MTQRTTDIRSGRVRVARTPSATPRVSAVVEGNTGGPADEFTKVKTPKAKAGGRVLSPAPVSEARAAELRAYFGEVEKEQWQFYAESVGTSTNHLPPDNVRVDKTGPVVIDHRTSPTNIGLYMLSTVMAEKLGLITKEQALTRLRDTTTSIEKLPKFQSTVVDKAGQTHPVEHLYNWYSIDGQPKEIGSGFISAVDNGNLASFLITIISALGETDPALTQRLQSMLEKMRFDVLYDKEAGLLHHGGYVKDGELALTAGHYDMVITEARCAYASAIMLGQIPESSWSRLKRKLGKELDNLNVDPKLDFQSYTGTMFEYLTPRLLMRHEGTPLGTADEQAVLAQMNQVTGGLWGRSEANSNTSKGYAAFGVKSLAQSKEFTSSGDDVIAPYAAQMAVGLVPVEVAANLEKMEAHGLRGKYGFYESVTIKKQDGKLNYEVTPQFYAHHIGMGFVAIANHLLKDVATDWFHDSALNQSKVVEKLLSTPASAYQQPAKVRPKAQQITNAYAYEAPVSYDKTEVIGSGQFITHVPKVGASSWANQSYALSHNELFYLRDNKTGQLLPMDLDAPKKVTNAHGGRTFEYVVPVPSGGELGVSIEIGMSADSKTKVSRLVVDNRTGEPQDLAVTGYLDWIMDDVNAYLNHPVYRNLYVETSLDEKNGVVLARRRTMQGADQDRQPHGFFAVGGKDAELDWADGSRTHVLGRMGSLAAPRAIVNGASEGEFGATLDPAAALTKSIVVQPNKKSEISFVFGFTDDTSKIPELIGRTGKRPTKSRRGTVPHYPPDTTHTRMMELARRTSRDLRVGGTSAASSAPSETAPPAEIGHFSADGRTFVIDKPMATQKPWSMVASNGEVGFVATATGWAYSFGINSQQNRLTPYVPDNTTEMPLRGVMVTDKTSGSTFSITPNPAPAPDTAYRTEVSPGTIKYVATRDDGLELSMTMAVASKDPAEFWSIEVKNESGKDVDLELASFLKWALGANYPATANQTTENHDAERGVIFASSTDSILPGSVAFHSVSGADGAVTKNALFSTPDDPFSGLSANLSVKKGETRQMSFMLGQAKSGEAAKALVDKYQAPTKVVTEITKSVQGTHQILDGLTVKTPDASLNAMLGTWLPYQAYNAHFLARSGYYQSGGAYGFRDQLQTVTNLLNTGNPFFYDVAKKHIVESTRHQFEKGDVQHWWHPHNNLGQRSTISDNLLWLPYALGHYLQVTGDQSILDEMTAFSVGSRELKPGELDYVEAMPFSEKAASVYEHAKRAIDLVLEQRMGEHGLPLIGKGDWNDGLDRVGHLGKGESVWLAFFLYDVLNKFAGIAEQRGDGEVASSYRAQAKRLRDDVDEHAWSGEHYIRAFADSGEKVDFNDAIVQAWAVLSGGAEPAKAMKGINAAVESLYKPEHKMILLFDRTLDKETWGGSLAAYPNGLRENNAQYTHGSSWLPRAVLESGDAELGLELYKAMLPTEHASDPKYGAEPYVVAADIYGGEKAGEGGWTWYSGGPSWIYRTGIETILGFKFQEGDQLTIDPTIPKDWPGFEASHKRGDTSWTIQVQNPDHVSRGVKEVRIDGQVLAPGAAIPLLEDGKSHQILVRMG